MPRRRPRAASCLVEALDEAWRYGSIGARCQQRDDQTPVQPARARLEAGKTESSGFLGHRAGRSGGCRRLPSSSSIWARSSRSSSSSSFQPRFLRGGNRHLEIAPSVIEAAAAPAPELARAARKTTRSLTRRPVLGVGAQLRRGAARPRLCARRRPRAARAAIRLERRRCIAGAAEVRRRLVGESCRLDWIAGFALQIARRPGPRTRGGRVDRLCDEHAASLR